MTDSIEGMYIVEFGKTPTPEGRGILFFETGKVLGGDFSFMFNGEYEVKNGEVLCKVRIQKHSPELPSIFDEALGRAITDFRLIILAQKSSNGNYFFSGNIEGAPLMKIEGAFKKVAELP